MPITLYESHNSRDMDGESITVRYVVTGTTNPMEVRQAVLLDTSPTFFDRVRREPRLTFVGGDFYAVEIPYTSGDASEAAQPEGQEGGENSGGPGSGGEGGGSGPGEGGEGAPGGPGGGGAPGEDDPLGFNVTFSTGGGTAHILLSKQTLFRARAGGGDPIDNERAIGLTKEGVEGCDIVTANGEFAVSRKRRTVTLAYLRTLLRLTGKTNRARFWGFAAGELLYLGADGQGSNLKGWTITHKFRYAENIPKDDERLVITPNLTIAHEKGGHHYVWCTYREKLVGDKEVYPLPTQVFLERVYEDGQFTDLQIGS